MFSERLHKQNGQMDTRTNGQKGIDGPVKRIRRSSCSPFLDARHLVFNRQRIQLIGMILKPDHFQQKLFVFILKNHSN